MPKMTDEQIQAIGARIKELEARVMALQADLVARECCGNCGRYQYSGGNLYRCELSGSGMAPFECCSDDWVLAGGRVKGQIKS